MKPIVRADGLVDGEGIVCWQRWKRKRINVIPCDNVNQTKRRMENTGKSEDAVDRWTCHQRDEVDRRYTANVFHSQSRPEKYSSHSGGGCFINFLALLPGTRNST